MHLIWMITVMKNDKSCDKQTNYFFLVKEKQILDQASTHSFEFLLTNLGDMPICSGAEDTIRCFVVWCHRFGALYVTQPRIANKHITPCIHMLIRYIYCVLLHSNWLVCESYINYVCMILINWVLWCKFI